MLQTCIFPAIDRIYEHVPTNSASNFVTHEILYTKRTVLWILNARPRVGASKPAPSHIATRTIVKGLTLLNAGLSFSFINSKSVGWSKYFILSRVLLLLNYRTRQTHTKVPVDGLGPTGRLKCPSANPNAISHSSNEVSTSVTEFPAHSNQSINIMCLGPVVTHHSRLRTCQIGRHLYCGL